MSRVPGVFSLLTAYTRHGNDLRRDVCTQVTATFACSTSYLLSVSYHGGWQHEGNTSADPPWPTKTSSEFDHPGRASHHRHRWRHMWALHSCTPSCWPAQFRLTPSVRDPAVWQAAYSRLGWCPMAIFNQHLIVFANQKVVFRLIFHCKYLSYTISALSA